ncbi:MAG: SIMPL domain-containing protein [Actinomycetes bacterium]|jgi:uncharacterized protein
MDETVKPNRFSTKFYSLIISALILAFGTGYGLSLVGQGLAARAGNSVTVTGQARTNATADNSVWTLNAQESSASAASAVTKVGKSVESLTKYLIAGGIPATGIQTGGVNTNAINEYINGNPTGRVLSYQASQSVTVRSKDVNRVYSLSNGIGSLLQTGVNINNYGPQFYVSNLAALRPALLAQAMVDAKARGISMTKAVGSSLGSVIAVSSGPVQVTSPDSVDTSGGGMYDTTTIPKTVTVTVSVSFKVN